MTLEDEIRAAGAAADEALLGNDAELISTFFTDDWVYVGPSGITAKTELIGWIASGRLAHHTMETVGPERIAPVGDSVVVTARRTSSGTWDGTPYRADEWISEILVRDDFGLWRKAFGQKSAVNLGG
ncbi:nuclear transport factor 2 family protein [Kribbella sp. NPDC051587]|uniref:nuclear transport factor 2 family protein n=1 Tax=Kribbella sp. NPDC051587 TaxID=3364119 RepID=UPI00378BFBE4